MQRVEESVAISGQIVPSDMTALVKAGIRMLINNRPDGESADQPAGAAIAAAARAAGIAYQAVPVGGAGIGPAELEAMDAALAGHEPTLAFCRSGARSVQLWALTRARQGMAPEQLIGAAAAAGFDLAPMAPTLTRLAMEAGQ